jgi:hypothetical protein
MTKISSASIRLVLKKNRSNALNENPVYIVVCFNGRKEKATGISCRVKDWDSKREVVKSTNSNSIVFNKILNDLKQKIINRRNEFEYIGKRYNPAMLLEDSIQELSANDNEYRVIYKRYLIEMASSDNTIKLYDYTYKVLKKYFGKEDFIINDVSLANIKKLIKSLDLGDNSIRGICGRVAAVWNYAIRKGIVDIKDYPFRDFVYSQKYKKENRTYYLEKCNLIKLRDYFFNCCLDISGELFSYKAGIEDRLMKRSSKEFALMYFLMLFISNGSSPIDIALLKVDNCSRVNIDGVDYWKIEFKRKKTGRGVTCLLERNIITMVCFEHYLGTAFMRGNYIYPILKDGMSDKQITNAIAKFTGYVSKNLKVICQEINQATIKENVEKGLEQPLIETEYMTLYVARHTKANDYLSHPGATIHGLATLMGRSVSGLDTYVHMIRNDRDLAAAESLSTI